MWVRGRRNRSFKCFSWITYIGKWNCKYASSSPEYHSIITSPLFPSNLFLSTRNIFQIKFQVQCCVLRWQCWHPLFYILVELKISRIFIYTGLAPYFSYITSSRISVNLFVDIWYGPSHARRFLRRDVMLTNFHRIWQIYFSLFFAFKMCWDSFGSCFNSLFTFSCFNF